MKLRSLWLVALGLMLAAPARAQLQLPPIQLPPIELPTNPPPINLDEVVPRLLTPVIRKEIYQRSPNGNPLIVRVSSASFAAYGYGHRLEAIRFAVKHAVQRWNEIGAVEPRLEYQTAEGVAGPEHGVINVYMVPGPSLTAWGSPIDVNLFTGVAWGGTVIFEAGGGEHWGRDDEIAELTIHEVGHAIGLGHTCRDPSMSVTGPVCRCDAVGPREMAVMAGLPCGSTFNEHLHGPTAEDLRALRSQNGSPLPRIHYDQRHHMSRDDAANWSLQNDNFWPTNMSSSPAVAANSGFAAHGYFAMAWRGDDGSERLNTILGYSNNWYFTTRRTFDSGSTGSRGQPALAADGYGNFLVATTESDSSDNGLSNQRRLGYSVFNAEFADTMPLLDVGSSSADSPGASFAWADSTHNYWVLAYVSRDSSNVLIRTARQNNPYVAPAPVGWNGETPVVIDGASVGALTGVGIACNPSAATGFAAGRCLLSFETNTMRAEENPGDFGNVRGVSFRIQPDGLPTDFQFLGFQSAVRASAAPAMAYNSWTRTFHLGVSQLDSQCWSHAKLPMGGGVWPNLSCPFQSQGMRPTLGGALVYSPWWGEVQYYGAE